MFVMVSMYVAVLFVVGESVLRRVRVVLFVAEVFNEEVRMLSVV